MIAFLLGRLRRGVEVKHIDWVKVGRGRRSDVGLFGFWFCYFLGNFHASRTVSFDIFLCDLFLPVVYAGSVIEVSAGEVADVAKMRIEVFEAEKTVGFGLGLHVKINIVFLMSKIV